MTLNLNEFNLVNEKIKSFISEYQLMSNFSASEFEKLHNELVECLDKKDFFEDLRLQLIFAFKQVDSGHIEYLYKHADSYHMLLWKIHKRLTQIQEKVDLNQLSEENELKRFDKLLSSKKAVFKENSTYFIVSYLGEAIGHISTIKVEVEKLTLEYNDHAPARTLVLISRLEKLGWNCSQMKTLKNIMPKEHSANNYFFLATKKRVKGDLEKLAIELELCIDTDWIILEDGEEYTDEELQREIKLIETAYILYDIYKLVPKDFLDMVTTILHINERRLDKNGT